MKKIKLLALLLVSVLSMNLWADSYTITFATGSGDGSTASTSTACSAVVSAGSDYLSGNLVTATKVYYSGGSGLKLGASSNAGTIKMNLSTAGQVTPTSIVVNAKLYNSSKATTLKVNGSATQDLTADFADYTFTITSKITYIELVTSKYAWIKSVTVNYGSDKPCTVTFNAGSNGTLSCPSCTNDGKLTEASAGAGITLPGCTANEGWKFLGWATTSGATTADAGKAGATYKPSKDITLYAVYVEVYTISWFANGTPLNPTYVEKGQTLVLPSDPDPATYCEGKTFMGWTSASSVNEDGSAITYAKDDDPVSASIPYYAVFADAQGGGEITYTKIESNTFDASATYLIGTSTTDFLGATSGSWGSIQPASSAYEFTLSGTGSSFTASCSAGKLAVATNSGSWSGYTESGGTMKLGNSGEILNSGGSLKLRKNGTSGFRWYSNTTGVQAYLYKKTGGTTYSNYTTTCGAVTPFTITLKRFGKEDEVHKDITQAFPLPTTGETGPCNDWKFIGWTANSTYTDGATSPVLVTNSGTETATYYAVYMQDALVDGDQVIIYNPDKNVALGTTTNGSRLNGIAPTISQDKSQITALGSNTAVLTVGYSGSDMYFVNGSEYLTCPATGSGMSFVSSIDIYSYWSYDPNTRYIKNKNAAYNSNPQYFEYYSGFTTYSLGGGGNAFIFDFYKKDGSVYNKVEWGGVTYSIQPKCKTQTVVTPDNTKSITVGGTTLDVASLFTITSGYDGTATYAIKSGSDCAGLNGTTLTATKEGSVVITCTAPETDNYKPASADATVTVNCGNTITITKGNNPTGGTFTINGQSTNLTDVCADGGYSVVVAAAPNQHYTLTNVTTSESGTVGAISNNSCTITDITVSTEINVEFTQDATYDVTLHIGNSTTTKSGIYAGTKFSELTELPTPAGTDAGDCANAFIGWATQAIDGVDADGTNVKWEDGETVITEDSKDFYAVFATESAGGAATTEELTKSEIQSITNPKLVYTTEKTYSGSTLNYSIYGNSDADGRPWIQQKNASGTYIKVTAPEDIKQVELTITSATNSSGGVTDITKHTAYSGSVGLVTTDCAFTTESANVGITSTITNNKATIATTASTKEVMIKVTTGARIWGIKTTYGAGTTYSDYVTSCVTPTATITAAVEAGQEAIGSVAIYNDVPETVTNPYTFNKGDDFMLEASISDDAYRFKEWTMSEGSDITLEDATDANPTLVAGAVNVTFTAHFELIPTEPRTVKFDAGELGTYDGGDITEEEAEGGITLPAATPNDKYHAFVGWSTSSAAENADAGAAGENFKPTEDNQTLYAVYARLYKVTLKYTDEALWQETVGGSVTLPSRNCKNETYKDHFAGWSETEFADETTNPTETPTIYKGSITPTKDVVLYPVFSVTAETTQWVKTTGDKVTEGVYAILCSSERAFNGSTTSGHGGTTTDAFEFDANNIATSVPTGICEITMQPYKNAQGTVLGYKMYNADKGYLYAKEAKSGSLAWQTTENSDWSWASNNWRYYSNSAYLRSYSGTAFRTYGNNSGDAAVHFAKKETASVGKYWSKPANDVVNPKLDLAAGDYLAPQTIKITVATYQSDYKYYYTTNGNEPDKTSTEYKYDAGIVLDAANTYIVKLIGYDEDGFSSQIVSAEYTIWATYSTLAEMYTGFQKDKLVGLSMTDAYIHKVNTTSGQNPTTQLFLQEKDSKLGVVLSMPTANVPEGITSEIEGKSITFTVTGKYALGSGRKQIGSAIIADGFTISEDKATRPTAEVKTVWDATLESTNLLGLIKLENVYVISENGTTIIVNTKADGQGTAYTIYDIFYAVGKVPESTLLCNVSGLFNVRDDVYSIMPVITEDFSLVTPTNATLPTLNIYGGSQDEPVKVGLNEVINITPADGFTAYYKVNDATDWTKITKQVESISLTVDTKLEVKSTRDYYNDATATYFYKIDASLTKYAVTIPSLSKTRGTVTVTLDAEEVASAKAGETLTITVSDITEHFHINSVSVVKSDDDTQTAAEVVSVSDGVYTFEMPECNVNIKVTYGEEKKYSITYQKGGIQAQGEDITEVAQYEGTVLTLKECTWTSDNYVFKGWKAQYNDGEKDVELPITNNTITVPAYDVKIIAQWNKIASYDWVLVTDASTLEAGDYVVIVSNAQGKVATSSITSGYMGEVAATFSSGKDYLNSVPTGAAILTLGGEASAWTLTDKDGRKLGATAAKNVAWDGQSATNTWTISVDANTYAATIQNTHKTNNSYDYGRFLHNVNSTRFTTYTSAANNTMLLPQLYKAVEHTYVVKYHLNGGSNKPADSHADADGKVTITTDVPTYTGHKFVSWNSEQEGTGQEYVGGREYTIEDDITVYAQWQEVLKYKITFEKGAEGVKGTLPTRADQYEAAQITMPGQNSLVYEGYVFRGWNDGENTYQEGDKYTMPAHDVTFIAVWESKADSKWHLVTNTDMLTNDSKIIIAAAGYNEAMGVIETGDSYCQEVAISKMTDVDHNNDQKLIDENEPVILTLVKNADGSFAFKNGTNYLTAQSTGNNIKYNTTIDAMSSWNITIEDGVTKIVTTGTAASKNLQYNSDAHRFSCYTGTQKAIAIYKYIDGNKAVRTLAANTYTTWCIPQGVEVGNFYGATFWNIADKAYMEDGVRLYSITIEQEEGNLGAGVPYIMLPDAETTEFVYYATGEEETAGTKNGLVGVFAKTMFDDNDPVANDEEAIARGIYIISNGTLYLCGNNCGVYANRAYILRDQIYSTAPTGAPRRTIGRPNDTPTTLNGLFGNQTIKAQKALIDGHIYIIRENKMYNAQGLFVK